MQPLSATADIAGARPAQPDYGGGDGEGSFTALLGMPPSQAMGLLLPLPMPVPLPSSAPTFPPDAGLVDRASRLSAFAGSGVCSPSTLPVTPASSSPPELPPAKRKETVKPAKGKAKKGKTTVEADDGEKPAYVHVRARRGQATDSHSLAERARREKINARMELLKELVPGCSKVSGTALVLDEIINHVQSLQRQVEYLSMRLAAVNPRIDFGGLDGFSASECGRFSELADKTRTDVEQWQELGAQEARQLIQLQQQFWQGDADAPTSAAPNMGKTSTPSDACQPRHLSFWL